MKIFQKIMAVVLFTVSVFVVLNGLNSFVWSLGLVQGSEFGVSIKLSGQLGLMTAWMGIFGLWRLVSASVAASEA